LRHDPRHRVKVKARYQIPLTFFDGRASVGLHNGEMRRNLERRVIDRMKADRFLDEKLNPVFAQQTADAPTPRIRVHRPIGVKDFGDGAGIRNERGG
jgi:hypothetical protein